jgi:hypothetical protein
MFVTQGIVAIVAAGVAVRRTQLRGFGFVESVFAGIAFAVVVSGALIFFVVTGTF